MIGWRDVPQFCHQGEDDQFGLCFWAMCGNHAVLQDRGVMPVGEIENAAREMEGFNPYIEATDRGESLEAGFRYIHENGWPGDPTLTISAWSKVPLVDVGNVILRRGACEAWAMLPMNMAGDDYDFSDGAVLRDALGAYAHAILIVEATPYGLTIITWGRSQWVPMVWARKYFRDCYEVTWEDIAQPGSVSV
jgi:hypothetical protein